MHFMHKAASAFALGGFLAGSLVVGYAAEDHKTVWEGVYTAAQASRGAQVYTQACSRCHQEDLSGYRSVLRGSHFMDQWREDNLRNLFTRVKTMPPNAPGSLKDDAYVDIVAYILQANSFPAGAQNLEAKALDQIRVEAKDGPGPVPDFSLVEVVGCLVKESEGKWGVSKATEPVRTRNPFQSSPEELKSARAQTAGKFMFHILDAINLPASVHHMDKVKAKGFLIRKTGDDRINITNVEYLSGNCAQ